MDLVGDDIKRETQAARPGLPLNNGVMVPLLIVPLWRFRGLSRLSGPSIAGPKIEQDTLRTEHVQK